MTQSKDYSNIQTISEAIDRIPQSSAYWRNVRKRLIKLSKRNAFEFWISYFDVLNQPDPDKTAELRDLLAANPEPSLADLAQYVTERNKVTK
jgi:hypothetical protein